MKKYILLSIYLVLVSCNKSGNSTASDGFLNTRTVASQREEDELVNQADNNYYILEDSTLEDNLNNSGNEKFKYSLKTAPTYGNITFNTSGDFKYVPNLNYNGSDMFEYEIEHNGKKHPKKARITISPVNDSPEITNSLSFETNEDVSLSASIIASDIDDAILSYTIVQYPSHGTLSLLPTGVFVYTPSRNYFGNDSFEVKVDDFVSSSNTETVHIKVNPVNDSPTAQDLSFGVDAGQTHTGNLLGSDIDSVELNYSLISNPNKGTISVDQSTGSFSYSARLGTTGTDTFTYKVSDGLLDSQLKTVTVYINPVNVAPVIADKNLSTNEDTQLNSNLEATDINNDQVTFQLIENVKHGSLTLNSDGTFTYIPDLNYVGVDSFTYKANDGMLDSLSKTVSIEVVPVNDAPVSLSKNFTVLEDHVLNSTINGSASDIEGSNLSYELVSNPIHGSVNLNSDGSFVYTPNNDYVGSDSFVFKVNDGELSSNNSVVSITVVSVSDAPVAKNFSLSLNEDETLNSNVDATDIDSAKNLLKFYVVSSVNHGTVTMGTNGTFTYVPELNYNGSDSFTYKVIDETGLEDTKSVNLLINPVNDTPLAQEINLSTDEDTSLNISLLGTDVDGDSLSYVVQSQPTHGALTGTGKNLVYTPSLNYNGADSFTYYVHDGKLGSELKTVNISVDSKNDLPISQNLSLTTNEDVQLNSNLVATDSDNDVLSYLLVTGPNHGTLTLNANGSFNYIPVANYNGTDTFTYKANDGKGDSNISTVTITVSPINDAPVSTNLTLSTLEDTVLNSNINTAASDVENSPLTYSLVGNVSHGTLTLNSNGSLIYTPVANYNGTDSFTYKVSDGSLFSNVSTVTINVSQVNDLPTTQNLSLTLAEDSSISSNLIGSDLDNDLITFSIVGSTSHGTVILTNPITGSFTYTPALNYNGTDTFTYKVNDGTGNSNISTVTLNITPVNDAPVTVNLAASTNEDTVLNSSLVAGASDIDGDSLSFSKVTSPTKGVVVVNTNGTFTYTPNANANGTDTFIYKVNDGTVDSNVSTVTITINSINDLPIAQNKSVSTNEDVTLSSSVLATDADNDTLSYSLVSSTTKGTLTLNSNGTFTYIPNANINGTDTFTYKANDGKGDSNTATVTITVSPVNDAPIFTNPTTINLTTNKNTAVQTTLASYDIEGSNVIYAVLTCPSGTCSVGASSGIVTYTPPSNFVGNVSFIIGCSDGTLNCNPQTTINISVIEPNTAPITTNINSTILVSETSINIQLYGYDFEGNPLTYTILTNPSNGTLSGLTGNNITYTLPSWTSCASENQGCNFSGTKLVRYGASGKYTYKIATNSIDCNNETFSDPNVGVAKSCSTNIVSTSFTYKVNDGFVDSTTSTVSINLVDWIDRSWLNRQKLVINNPTGSTLADFPILVKLDSSKINYSNFKSNGEDIRFYSNGGIPLSYEIEKWNTTGESLIWVKVPFLVNNSSNLHIWMYYNNFAANDAQNKTDVWSNGYVAVWHLNQTTGTVLDSTSNNNNGSVYGTLTRNTSTGPLGNSYTNASNSACFNLNHNSSHSIYPNITMETWAKVNTLANNRYFIQKDVNQSGSWATAYGMGVTKNSSKLFVTTTDSQGANTLGSEDVTVSTSASVNTDWKYYATTIAGQWNKPHDYYMYTNGRVTDSYTSSNDDSGSLYSGTYYVNLNIMGDCYSQGFLGSMDEIRISNVIRSSDWIRAQYLSMTDSLLMFTKSQTISVAKNNSAHLIRISSNLDDGMIIKATNTLYQSGQSNTNWVGETNNQDAWGYLRFRVPEQILGTNNILTARVSLMGKGDGTQIWNNSSNFLKLYAQSNTNPSQITSASECPNCTSGVNLISQFSYWNDSSLTWNFTKRNFSPDVSSTINSLISLNNGISKDSSFQLWLNRGSSFNCGASSYCEVGYEDYAGLKDGEPMILLEWE